MSKLCITLPPFAPDYSGAASALFELGGMIVIHDASGCTGNYTGFDEPRWFGSSSAVYCSGLRHMDAVLGNDEKFISAAVEAAESIKPAFVAVLGSPVPTVIGTDLKGMASEIEAASGIPSFGLDTKGLAYYGKGIYDATAAVMKRFAGEKTDTVERSVNILGMTPLDFYTKGWEKKFAGLFEENGITVTACFSMGMTLEDMKKSPSAQLNIAVSQAGVQIAEYMEKKYGIPYIAVTPLGDGSVVLEKVELALKGIDDRCEYNYDDAQVLIAGEQIISDSVREYIYKKYGVKADTAVLFDCTAKYMSRNDIEIKNELHLRKVLNSGKYKTVVGDPMIKALIKKENTEKIKFIPFPHVAVSSKVHWDEYIDFLGENSISWLENIR